jgi:phosphoesterase RecJ-like protein
MLTTNKLDWAAASAALNAAQTVLLVTHMNPDGDAVGSLLGLAAILRERGKTVTAAVDEGVPPLFRFLMGAGTVLPKLTLDSWDVMISLDASDEVRTGAVGVYGRAHCRTVINIDHHPTNTLFGDYHLIAIDAASTTEILYRWLAHLAHPLTEPVATALLTGLVTDTRGFRTTSTRQETLAVAQALMQAGAALDDISARTLDTMPYGVLSLWRYALDSMTLENRVIAASVTRQHVEQTGQSDLNDGGLVNLLITVNEADIAVVFREKEVGEISISMRSKPGFDVSRVAFELGGGGHKQAAGATIPGSLEAVRLRVLPMLDAIAQASVQASQGEEG